GTELDEALAVVHLDQAAVLAGTGGSVHGFRVAVEDVFAAPRMGWELVNALPPGFYATDWTQTHGNLYAAIQMSRDLVILLLFSIIAIAAFNVVSSLVLVVVDKRADIAILRAQGARPGDIGGIFLRQGLLIALAGTLLGSALGIAASLGVTDLVAGLERWLGIRFLDTDVYPIGYLPSDLRVEDLLLINGVAVILCFLAALYPARRAARLPPADALRHE
ncbi:MAG: FtsX-like permease family protein, partial [Halieaceae bacterium]|nr:FtsX-like permease family protein [Halieaceae bacterium]